MVILNRHSKRKPSGARYKLNKIPRLHQRGSEPSLTKIDSTRIKTVRTKGGGQKHKLLATNEAIVVDKSGKPTRTAIKAVNENSANRHFVRRNIMTKGAIIETDLGQARITNRPGQSGMVQAVLI